MKTSLSDVKGYSCPVCMDLGYVISKQGEFSVASVCKCSEHCEICDDFGFTIEVVEGVSVSRKCKCRMLRDRIKLFNAAGIPARYSDKTLERYEAFNSSQGTIKSHLSRYQDAFSPNAKGVLLYGSTGVGKTHLVVSTMRYLALEKGFSVRFVDFFALLQQVKATFTNGGSEDAIIAGLDRADLLVIDELGKGRATEWEKTVVDSLIARRYNSGKTLFITTNYDVKDGRAGGLPERVGMRVMSRLYEMCEFFSIDGDDYRKGLSKN